MEQNNIIGYDPQTGQPIYDNQNKNIIGYDPQTGQPIYDNQNSNLQQTVQPQMQNVQQPMQQPVQPQMQSIQQPIQSQMNTNHTSNEQPQKKSNKTLIIFGIIAIIAIIAGIFLFINRDEKETGNNEISNNSEIENNNMGENEQQNNSDSSNDLIEEEYTGEKQDLIISTVGHYDHGKSTLTSAITKFYGTYKTADEISNAPEVNKNGVTYNETLVEYKTSKNNYFHYDMPGHVDYIRSIISGAIKLDGAILVVSAADGPMPQTREHLMLLQKAGVNKIVVYISKIDMVDDEELISLVETEIKELIGEYGFDSENTPIIKGSALKAIEGDKKGETSIKELINSMDKWFTKRISNESSNSYTKFDATVYILTRDEDGRTAPFQDNYNAQFSISSTKENATITLPAGVEMVMPGDNLDVTITLENEMSLKKGDYFQILEGNKLVGVGIVKSTE